MMKNCVKIISEFNLQGSFYHHTVCALNWEDAVVKHPKYAYARVALA